MQRDLLLLREMIDAAEQAQRLVAGRTASEVEADRLRRDSLLWNFTVLGEASTLVSDETKARFPDIPWRNPARLRNRVVHGHWCRKPIQAWIGWAAAVVSCSASSATSKS